MSGKIDATSRIRQLLALAQADFGHANATMAEYQIACEQRNWAKAEELRGKTLHHIAEYLDHFAIAYREMGKL